MLVPAISRRDDVIAEFAKILYTEDYFYYHGCGHGHYIPELKDEDNHYQWVSIGDNDKICGYIAYRVNPITDRIFNFGMISFDHNDLTFARDVLSHVDELVNRYRAAEFRMIDGNPIKKYYDRVMEQYNGTCIKLHGVTRDNDGKLRDEWLYEIYKEDFGNERS